MTTRNRPHIAYLSASDPLDKRSWSGVHHFVFSSLQKHLGDVSPLGPWQPKNLVQRGRAFSFASAKITGKRFDYNHSLKLAKAYGRYFSEKLREKNMISFLQWRLPANWLFSKPICPLPISPMQLLPA